MLELQDRNKILADFDKRQTRTMIQCAMEDRVHCTCKSRLLFGTTCVTAVDGVISAVNCLRCARDVHRRYRALDISFVSYDAKYGRRMHV